MASINKFISVLSPTVAPESGSADLVLEIKSINRNPAESITVSLIAVAPDIDEIALAELIKDAINAELDLVDLAYDGSPNFGIQGLPPPFTFRAIQCDHYVDLWSQSQYRIVVTTNNTGAKIVVENIPIFLTITEYDSLRNFVTSAFVPTVPNDNEEKAIFLKNGSQALIDLADGYNMVSTQYLHEERAFNTNGFMLDFYPVTSWDKPVPKLPNLTALEQFLIAPLANFEVDYSTGQVTFPDFLFFHPLWQDNVVKMSYVAGLSSIPHTLKKEAITMAQLSQVPSDFGTLKIGSASITKEDRSKAEESIRSKLRGLLNV